MHTLKRICAPLFRLEWEKTNFVQSQGIKYFRPPISYDHIILPEKPKLRFIEKVPPMPAGIKPPKMQKRLRLMRGPELVHNKLLHKQYGIVALGGGRMSQEHFEVVRLGIIKKMDVKRMFAIWRVDPPWQPLTKKGQGQRMGGGKGAIDHYVTPVKEGRIILEMGGKCEFKEVFRMLRIASERLPFPAKVVSQTMMNIERAKAKLDEEKNTNPYTMKYLIQNNMQGCHNWLSPFDMKFLGKYR